ncbi:MAG: hypothetical protein IT342_03950 [Candidatus Melainabacteria bacterium]|nr:hypothetical protein [Candidatus Melainabacteria bacterium]
MDIKKVFVYGFFGAIGAVILSLLSAVGGFAGAGTSLLVISLGVNVLAASLIGGVTAAAAFHTLIKGVDSFLVKTAEEKEKKAGTPVKAPCLAQNRRYLWGSVSYFISTVIGVNLITALISNPTWSVIATIIGSGLLGLAGLAVVVKLKLWEPDFKQKDEQR